MNLFIFFALPLATILLAIVLQKVLRSPILVAITFFAIYLIVAFAAFQDTLAEAIIAAIIYTIIAYITAVIVRFIKRLFCFHNENITNSLGIRNNNIQSSNLLTVDSNCFTDNMEENNTNSIIDDVPTTETITQNQIRNRPVALGNNIVKRNLQGRAYRRW